DLGEHRVVEVRPLERAVALEDDVALAVRGHQVGVEVGRAPRDLVDRRRHAGGGGQLVDLLDRVVADADRAGLAGLLGGDDVLPHVRAGLLVRRPVHQPQVDVVEAQPRQRLVDDARRVVGLVRRQLGGHEDLLARQAGVGDRAADGLLVAVGAGGVDVPVADLQRRAHRLVGLVVGGLPGAQAQQRDLDAGAQGDGRDRVLDRFIAHGSHSATRVSVAAVRGRGSRATGAPGRLGGMDAPQLAPLPEDWDSALAIVAHPDDMEYGMSAAVARWTAQGKTVSYLLVTRGEAGIDTMPPEETVRVRAAEQRAACDAVGVETLEYLDHPDGVIHDVMRLRR